MENPITPPENLAQPFSRSYRVPVEEMLFGSTPTEQGVSFNIQQAFLQAFETDSPQAWDRILRPTILKEGRASLEQVNLTRGLKQFIEGTLLPLGQTGFDIDDDGLIPRLYLPLAKDDGAIEPSWKISLVNEEGEEVSVSDQAKYFNQVALEGEIYSHFEITRDERGEFYLSIKSSQQQPL